MAVQAYNAMFGPAWETTVKRRSTKTTQDSEPRYRQQRVLSETAAINLRRDINHYNFGLFIDMVLP